jgi:hypothetical protein
MQALVRLGRNGSAVRAILLAVATVVLIAVGRPILVPIAVSLYAIANAAAISRSALRPARPEEVPSNASPCS